MNDFDSLLEELAGALAVPGKSRFAGAPAGRRRVSLPSDPRLREFDRDEAQQKSFAPRRKTYASARTPGSVDIYPDRANYGLPPQTPGDYLAAGAEALWQGGRAAVGAEEDAGAFGPGGAGDFISRIAPFVHPATALPMLSYQGGRAVGSVRNALADPTPGNIASMGIESAFVPLAAAPAARGVAGRFIAPLASRKAAVGGLGVGAGAVGTAIGMTSAEAAEKKKTSEAVVGPESSDTVLKSMAQQIKDLERQMRNTRNKDRIASYNEQLGKLRADYNKRLSDLTQSDLPFEQAFPGLSQSWPFIQALGPAALGAVMKGKASIGARASGRGWRNTLAAGERAVDDMNPQAATAAGDRARSYLTQHRWDAPARAAESVSPMIAGGALGAELSVFPAQYDAVMAPTGSPEQVAGAERARDPYRYAPGAAIGMLSAGTGAHLVPGYRAPVGRTTALLSQVGSTPQETARKMSAGIDAQGVVDASRLARQRAAADAGADTFAAGVSAAGRVDEAEAAREIARINQAVQIEAARSGQQAASLLRQGLLRQLDAALRAKRVSPGKGQPSPQGPVDEPTPRPPGTQPPQGPQNPSSEAHQQTIRGDRNQPRPSAYSGNARMLTRDIWDAELDSVKPEARATYAPDIDALAKRMAAKLASQGYNIPVETLKKRIAGSAELMESLRASGGDAWSAAGRRNMVSGGDKSLGLLLGALAAQEAARADRGSRGLLPDE